MSVSPTARSQAAGRPATGSRFPGAAPVRRAAACARACWLLPAMAFPQQDLSDLEKRLAAINAQVKALREKISEESQKESTLLSELERISLSKRLIRKELDARNLELEKVARETAVIRRNIEELQ